MHTVYILYSTKFDKIYIGCTSDLEVRFKSHNELGTKGWTIKFRPWVILHTEEFDSKREALDRENISKVGKEENGSEMKSLQDIKQAHIRLRRTSSSLVSTTREKLLTKVRSFFCALKYLPHSLFPKKMIWLHSFFPLS